MYIISYSIRSAVLLSRYVNIYDYHCAYVTLSLDFFLVVLRFDLRGGATTPFRGGGTRLVRRMSAGLMGLVFAMALQNRLHSALLCGSLKAITHTTASLWVGVQQMCGNIKAITHVCGSLKAITHATASLWVGGQTNVW